MCVRLSWVVLLYALSGTILAENACERRNAEREVFFGDLHVHTTLSLDARTQDTRNTPADAYRFARGARVGVQPYDSDGRATRFVQLERPLDFATVTDHAEMLGEQRICDTPGATGHYSIPCLLLRHAPRLSLFVIMSRASSGNQPRYDFCGEEGRYCQEQALQPWGEIQAAAHAAYDPCNFTTFVGYEWTKSSVANLHRNIIFRGESVLRMPISVMERNNAESMLGQLERDCTGECEAISIPHNSNLSDGMMFPSYDTGVLDLADVHLRQRMEPLVEVIQHKGSSECWYDAFPDADELCAFEQLPYNLFSGNLAMYPEFMVSAGIITQVPPAASAGYVRSVLVEGFKYERALDVNPYRLGFVGGTDTHLGIAGAVSEYNFYGHGGAGASHRKEQIEPGFVDNIETNPGALAAVWAEENTRDSIFEALRRRETYVTSGPRIRLRTFAGFKYSADICTAGNVAQAGYADGVPMGGVLQAVSGGTPSLLVEALADSGTLAHPGIQLQRLQVIKGWVGDGGESQYRVYDIAGDADNGAGVDEQTCKTYGDGAARLCAVWRDPDFDESKSAYYYVRAVENPSCRWSARTCIAQGVNCASMKDVPEGLLACCTQDYPKAIQERAISSPIWYEPVEK